MYKRMQALEIAFRGERRALCASEKSASAVAGIYVYVRVYDHVDISHIVYCHTGHTKYMRARVCVCVCVCVCVPF